MKTPTASWPTSGERASGEHPGDARRSSLAQFFEFVIPRYQGDIAALTGYVVEQPIDEFNKPARPLAGGCAFRPRTMKSTSCSPTGASPLPSARKYLPAARDYFAASLWRRLGLRINETVMLDIRDWRPDLGGLGQAACPTRQRQPGPRPEGRGLSRRSTAPIELIDWWLADVRHQFGDDWSDPDAPMLPERTARPGAAPLPSGRRRGVAPRAWPARPPGSLPAWSGRLTPHVLRHYCASSLYGSGMDLKALQELLGHEWLSTTTRYIHVRSDHIEQAWADANRRLRPDSGREVSAMQWNLRMKAAERGIWKSTELRRMLADGRARDQRREDVGALDRHPDTVRLDELDVICHVLECDPSELLIPEPDKVAARRPEAVQAGEAGRASPAVAPRFGKGRSAPPV